MVTGSDVGDAWSVRVDLQWLGTFENMGTDASPAPVLVIRPFDAICLQKKKIPGEDVWQHEYLRDGQDPFLTSREQAVRDYADFHVLTVGMGCGVLASKAQQVL